MELTFETATVAEIDELIDLESHLGYLITGKGLVDGHDIEQGTFTTNIFTEDPHALFEMVQKVLSYSTWKDNYTAGVKNLDIDEYTPIWPDEFVGEFGKAPWDVPEPDIQNADPFYDFNLEQWLTDRSIKKEFVDNEWVFTHKDNSTSVLVPRDEDSRSGDELLMSSPLSWFYDKYLCVSIDNSALMLASSISGGVEISHGYKVPDCEGMTETLNTLDVTVEKGDVFFAVESGWMFTYAIRKIGSQYKLIRFDRDFQTSEEIQSIRSVFDDWWTGVCDEIGFG